MRLESVIAFVTGAAGGIGRAVCGRFLEEGARLVAADRDAEAVATLFPEAVADGRLVAVGCDITEPDQVRTAISRAVATYGELTTLCNIAGGSSARDGRVTEATDDEFWRVIRVDLYGTFLVAKYGIPELVKAGGGAVINASSALTVTPVIQRDCYAGAKGGFAAMTRSIAAGYARDAIRANAIAPGRTLTPRVRAVSEDSEHALKLNPRHLLGLLDPMDIANMFVFLASEEARHLTGQVIPVDSGMTVS